MKIADFLIMIYGASTYSWIHGHFDWPSLLVYSIGVLMVFAIYRLAPVIKARICGKKHGQEPHAGNVGESIDAIRPKHK